jgi:hypothetical protein
MLMPLQMAVGHGKDDDDEQTESLLSLSTKEGSAHKSSKISLKVNSVF